MPLGGGCNSEILWQRPEKSAIRISDGPQNYAARNSLGSAVVK